MAPSTLQIQANSTIAALKAAFDHFTSSNYPPEWDLRFHITFAVFQSLLMITNKFTAEEVTRLDKLSDLIVPSYDDKASPTPEGNVGDSRRCTTFRIRARGSVGAGPQGHNQAWTNK